MAARERLLQATAALLGISAYEAPINTYAPSDVDVERMRRLLGGQLQPLASTRTRWYMSDLETAELLADMGDLSWAAELTASARKDGVVAGVLSTRTSGLVRLPKVFRGDDEVIAELELGHDETRSVFDEIFPPTELALLAADGEMLGVGVGELVPVQGREFPVFVRLDPRFLRYRWNEARWYFTSVAGPVPITPGDGRWILHTPGGRATPWQHGLWKAVGRAYIRKEHAAAHKDAWEGKLAHPARVAVAPQGASEPQKDSWFKQVMAWGINSVFSMTPGYDVKLLESNGRGYDSFLKTIADQNYEITICIAGQTVTTDGGTGFANADIHKSIRADLIKATADALAFTINTQGIPAFIEGRWGLERLSPGAHVSWDVTPPKDRTVEATALNTAAQAIEALDRALAAKGIALDVEAMCERFGIPVKRDAVPDVQEQPSTNLTLVREVA